MRVNCEQELMLNNKLALFEKEDADTDCVINVTFTENVPNISEPDENRCYLYNINEEEASRPYAGIEYNGGICNVTVIDGLKDGFGVMSAIKSARLHHILAAHGAVILHASYVLINGEAILFSAPCGTGKSTQAELWKKHRGARIVNGDRAIVRFTENGLTAGGIYYSGTSEYCENYTAPLKAIVLLGQAKENSVTRCGGGEAMRRLFRECTYTAEFENDPAKIAGIVADVVNSVPVYKLDCLPDESAVTALEEVLYGS